MAFGSWQFRRWADRWNKLSECCTPDENSLPERGGGNTLLFPPSPFHPPLPPFPRPALSFFPSFYFRSDSFPRTFSLSLSFFLSRRRRAHHALVGNNKRELDTDAIPKGNFSSSRLTIPSPFVRLEDPWIRFHTTITIRYHRATNT